MLVPGQTLSGTYAIERPLGSGGMADVYLVRHTRLPRHFALKVLKLELSTRPELIERFRREAEVLARLRSPHIVSVVDMNQTEDGWPYLVMDYLAGETLASRIRRCGPLAVGEASELFGQMCEGVLAAHEQGVIHRDLKPNNLFLVPGPRGDLVQILDFGIAKLCEEGRTPLTRDSVLMGTPGYMAPEQALGQKSVSDFRIDQFALGAVLYEMLAGRPAFLIPGEPMMRTMQRLVYEDPTPLPETMLSPILKRALAKEPKERYPSLRQLLSELRSLPTNQRRQAPSEVSPTAYEREPLAARRRRLWPIAVIASLAGFGAVGALLSQRSSLRSPSPSETAVPTKSPSVTQPYRAAPPIASSMITATPTAPVPTSAQAAPAVAPVLNDVKVATSPPLPAKSRVGLKLTRSFVVVGATSAQEKLLRLCAEKELSDLPGLYPTSLRLERSGALQLTQAPEVVYRSGFDACLRQVFTATRTPLPEQVTVRVQFQRQKP